MVIWQQQNEMNHSIYATVPSRAENPSTRKLNSETPPPNNPTIERFNRISAVKDEYTRPLWVVLPLFEVAPKRRTERREPATPNVTFSVLVTRFIPRWREKKKKKK